MQMPEKDDNVSDNIGPYENEKSVLERQDIEENDIDQVGRSLDIENYAKNMLSRHIL